MKGKISKIYKDEYNVKVFQLEKEPDYIYKQYLLDYDVYDTIDALREKRKKMIAMKNRKEWPAFLIRPNEVGRLNKESFKVKFPYIDGMILRKLVATYDIDIVTCAKLIKKMEESIYAQKDIVFPDLANPGNVMLLLDNMEITSFKLIDADDVQFDCYVSNVQSSLLGSSFDISQIRGIKKCKNGVLYNKQLDIRSMYALLYYIMNVEDYFYPIFIERNSITEYEKLLHTINIPENSALYEKTMNTLDENKPNEPIGDSLLELIDEGYSFESYFSAPNFKCHRLRKLR